MKNYEPWPRRKGDCDFIKRSWDMLGVSIACYSRYDGGCDGLCKYPMNQKECPKYKNTKDKGATNG